jgi:hypothetical protein
MDIADEGLFLKNFLVKSMTYVIFGQQKAPHEAGQY